MGRKPAPKSSKNGKAGKGNNGNLTPPVKGENRNPQGINAFTRFGAAVMAQMKELVPIILPDGQSTLMKGDDILARQLVRGALDYNAKSCSEKQHHLYFTELLKRYWPVPKEDKPVVPIQIVVQAGPQEAFVKRVTANGQATPDGILEALGDLSEGGNGHTSA